MAKDEGSERRGLWPAESHRDRRVERLIAVFALGLVLFDPLLMHIFDRGSSTTVAGIPLLIIYVFLAWVSVIVCVALIVEGPWSAYGRRGLGTGGHIQKESDQ